VGRLVGVWFGGRLGMSGRLILRGGPEFCDDHGPLFFLKIRHHLLNGNSLAPLKPAAGAFFFVCSNEAMFSQGA